MKSIFVVQWVENDYSDAIYMAPTEFENSTKYSQLGNAFT